jgi:hypothetical protein
MKVSYSEMIKAILEAIKLPENCKNGYTNWDFVDADIYSQFGGRFINPKAYQRCFEACVEMLADEELDAELQAL